MIEEDFIAELAPGDDLEALRLALHEVKAVGRGKPDATWLDRRNDPDLIAYVIADGVLHKVDGSRDLVPDAETPSDHATTFCTYTASAISGNWGWSLDVSRGVGGPAGLRTGWKWSFDFGDERLDFEVSGAGDDGREHFARALASAITHARRTDA